MIGEDIIAQGSTHLRAQKAANASRPKEKAEIIFVQNSQKLILPQIVSKIQEIFTGQQKIYLVGGAVRDLLINKDSNDFDFVVEQNAIGLGRKVADHFAADFYVLDAERDAARVILRNQDDQGTILDFVSQKGANIDDDLEARDFSINAMAIALNEEQGLYDPCDGAIDLREKSLRNCSSKSIKQDPIRIIRAIRLAAQFGLKIEKSTLASIKENVALLHESSPERIRDEFMRTISLPNVKKSLQALEIIGALQIIIPELAILKTMEQSPPHRFNVWEHTLQTIENLEKILSVLDSNYPAKGAKDLYSGLIVLSLGRYRNQISELLNRHFVEGRSRTGLLILAALLHDVGKGVTQDIGKNRIRYPKHEFAGAEVAESRLKALHFSKLEIKNIVQIIGAHKRPTEISRKMKNPDKLSIFRYFQELGESGIEVGLHSIADLMGRHGFELTEKILNKRLAVIRPLFEAYFNDFDQLVEPKLLLGGEDLMQKFGLDSGPIVGAILKALKEGQAIGEISSKKKALDFAKKYIAENSPT